MLNGVLEPPQITQKEKVERGLLENLVKALVSSGPEKEFENNNFNCFSIFF